MFALPNHLDYTRESRLQIGPRTAHSTSSAGPLLSQLHSDNYTWDLGDLTELHPSHEESGEFLPLTDDGFPKSEPASEKEPGNLSLATSQKILPQKARCLILLDTEHSHGDCATLCRFIWVTTQTKLESTSKQSLAPSTIPTLTPM